MSGTDLGKGIEYRLHGSIVGRGLINDPYNPSWRYHPHILTDTIPLSFVDYQVVFRKLIAIFDYLCPIHLILLWSI